MKGAHWHVQHDLRYHIVLVTKYRVRVIDSEVYSDLKTHVSKLLENWNVELLTIGGEENHVHLEIRAHPSLELATLINSVKTATSRIIRKKHKEHVTKFLNKGFWSRAYYIKTIGEVSEDIVKDYIEKHKF